MLSSFSEVIQFYINQRESAKVSTPTNRIYNTTVTMSLVSLKSTNIAITFNN
jgi:hypothetical protein